MSTSHPLSDFYAHREEAIDEVTERTLLEIASRGTEPKNAGNRFDGVSSRAFQEKLIAESLEQEFKRIESTKASLRDVIDKTFWEGIASAFKARSAETDLGPLFERIVRYHAEEITGNFDPKVYRMATLVVPNGFNWMLRTLDWKSVWTAFRSLLNEKIDLRRKVHLIGSIEHIKKLAEKGTVVLVPTHFSNMDSVLLGWAVYELGLPPFCYGAGLNLFSNPVLGYFMNNLGAYKVDRRKKHRLYRWTLLNYSTTALEKNCHSLFFPGGARSRSGSPEFVSGQLKPGLLSTVLRAYIHNLHRKKTKPNIYVVPCVISYHVVLEASSLIADHLSRSGANPFMMEKDESSTPKVLGKFVYNFLRGSSSAYLHFCKPLDPFGNVVDEDGNSRTRSGRLIDLSDYVKTNGEITSEPQRDREYGAILSERILERYKEENLLLSSHFAAYCYFEYLLKTKADGNLLDLLKYTPESCDVRFEDFTAFSRPILSKVHELHEASKLNLEPALRSTDLYNIVEAASRNLGAYHTSFPLKFDGEKLQTRDLKLLYYYHNRMDGYGFADQ